MKYFSKKGLTHREYLFCGNYVNSGDVKKSALMAGYKVEPVLVKNFYSAMTSILKSMNYTHKKRKIFSIRLAAAMRN